MKRKLIFLAAIVVMLLFTTTSAHSRRGIRVLSELSHGNVNIGRYLALVIGINDYEDEKISDLKTAVKDAEELAAILESRYGFQVELLVNEKATKKNIYQALRNLVKRATPNDSVLLYYAGHGEIDRTFDDGWWIPVDAEGGDPITYLDNIQVQKAIKSLQARHVLLIADSCYAGTLFGQFRSLPKLIDDKYYLSLYNEVSRWAMTSGNKTPVGDEGTDGHSLFAYQLLKQLRDNRKPFIATQEIYSQIAPIVSNNSEQTPMYRPIRETGDQGGEFVFVASSGALVDMPSKSPQTSMLSVTSNLTAADVFLDDRYIGKTNISRLEVEPGTYVIKVKLKGCEPYEREVVLTEGRHESLYSFLEKIELSKGTLHVYTEPRDAVVELLNVPMRFFQGIALDPGRYHIQVSAEGHVSSKTWVSLTFAEDKELTIPLRPQKGKPSPTSTVESTARPSLNAEDSAAFQPVHSSVDSDDGSTAGRGAPAADDKDQHGVVNTLGMHFVYVGPGKFIMGSRKEEDGRSSDESPHQVTLTKGFYIGRQEVTVGQWRKFFQKTGYRTAAETTSAGKSNSRPDWRAVYAYEPAKTDEVETFAAKYWDAPGFPQTDALPVTCVTWEDVQQFIRWLTMVDGKVYRLPTEAEWEFACRGAGQASRFWGSAPSHACRFANIADQKLQQQHMTTEIHGCNDRFVYPAPVGSFRPNGFGLYDMLGNVSEWCQDIYGKYKIRRAMSYLGVPKRITIETVDPEGPGWGFSRVVRGGNWQSAPPASRSAHRIGKDEDYWDNRLGFRLVRDS